MVNRWIEHVKNYAQKNNISYMCALCEISNDKNKKGYVSKPKKDKPRLKVKDELTPKGEDEDEFKLRFDTFLKNNIDNIKNILNNLDLENRCIKRQLFYYDYSHDKFDSDEYKQCVNSYNETQKFINSNYDNLSKNAKYYLDRSEHFNKDTGKMKPVIKSLSDEDIKYYINLEKEQYLWLLESVLKKINIPKGQIINNKFVDTIMTDNIKRLYDNYIKFFNLSDYKNWSRPYTINGLLYNIRKDRNDWEKKYNAKRFNV